MSDTDIVTRLSNRIRVIVILVAGTSVFTITSQLSIGSELCRAMNENVAEGASGKLGQLDVERQSSLKAIMRPIYVLSSSLSINSLDNGTSSKRSKKIAKNDSRGQSYMQRRAGPVGGNEKPGDTLQVAGNEMKHVELAGEGAANEKAFEPTTTTSKEAAKTEQKESTTGNEEGVKKADAQKRAPEAPKNKPTTGNPTGTLFNPIERLFKW